jgi:1-acyl-sn-glycerol-3-phosphate acyltransferase
MLRQATVGGESMRDGSMPVGWAHGLFGRASRWLLQHAVLFPALQLITPVIVRDKELLAEVDNPVIVVANHVSHLDTPVVIRALPPRVRWRLVVAAAKDYFYRGRIRGALVSLSLATIPFDRAEGARESLLQCEALLRNGSSVLIFPEGTRSPTGDLGRVRTGAAVLAVETRTAVLPLFVHGLADVMPKGRAAPLPGAVVVDVGDVLRAETGEEASAFRGRIEAALRKLAARRPEWGTTPPRIPGGC